MAGDKKKLSWYKACIQCGVTSGKVEFLKLKQSFSGLGVFDVFNVVQVGVSPGTDPGC
jgi:hypothetical protein